MSGARHKARIRAVEVLYEAEVRGVPVTEVIRRREEQPVAPTTPFTEHLASGADEHRARIDALIDTYAVDWTVDRMPVVDRNVLRVGVYELLWDEDTPDGVAIAEAVAVARELSGEESPNFINGLLSRLLEYKESLPL